MKSFLIVSVLFSLISCGKEKDENEYQYKEFFTSEACMNQKQAVYACIDLNREEGEDSIILCNTIYSDPEACYKTVRRFYFPK